MGPGGEMGKCVLETCTHVHAHVHVHVCNMCSILLAHLASGGLGLAMSETHDAMRALASSTQIKPTMLNYFSSFTLYKS